MTDAEHEIHLAALAAELITRAPLTLVVSAPTALQLAGLLQLALRHPKMAEMENVSQTAILLLGQIRSYFDDAPVTRDVIRAGDDPRNDE